MACLGVFDPGALLLFPLGGPGTAGVYLAQSAADAETDRAAGLDNLGARLGARRTAMLAAALVGGTVVLAVLVAWFAPALAVDPRAVAMWAVPSGALVITGATLAARGSDQAIRRCFVPLALALAVIGFGWVRAGR
jgi:4-hydroxybenzoate polyprenyltransferase